MNDKAKKKARQAELEDYLLHVFYKCNGGSFGDFVQWLEYTANSDSLLTKHNEALELIAIYEAD